MLKTIQQVIDVSRVANCHACILEFSEKWKRQERIVINDANQIKSNKLMIKYITRLVSCMQNQLTSVVDFT